MLSFLGIKSRGKSIMVKSKAKQEKKEEKKEERKKHKAKQRKRATIKRVALFILWLSVIGGIATAGAMFLKDKIEF